MLPLLQTSVPAALAELVGAVVATLPAPLSTAGIATYGGGGAGIVFLRRMVKRWRESHGSLDEVPAGTAIPTKDAPGTRSVTVDTLPEASKQKVAFVLPSFVPVGEGVREVTTDEVHALELGLVLGFATVWLISAGQENFATTLAILFIGGALGYRRLGSKAVETIRKEPWYGLVSYAIGAGISYLVFFTPVVGG